MLIHKKLLPQLVLVCVKGQSILGGLDRFEGEGPLVFLSLICILIYMCLRPPI